VSGGHFDYNDWHIDQIADIIECDIITSRQNLSPETINKLIECYNSLKLLSKRVHRADWLLSGDDGEDSFADFWEQDAEIAETESLTAAKLASRRQSLYKSKRKELEKLLPEQEEKLKAFPPPWPAPKDGRYHYDRTTSFMESIEDAKSHLNRKFNDCSEALTDIDHVLDILECFNHFHTKVKIHSSIDILFLLVQPER
jgi:hypothetical protein